MKLIDYYYRAFKEYRKETQKNKSCSNDRQKFSKTDIEFDKLVVKKYLCKIEEDWISEIEEKLVFVENAVKAERQFIRTNGEVVPIEKIKKVSKESVSHLAKHSDLITHLPEDENDDIIPDKLYMIEKLSDFSVYENKFLYKLLCYLRDFTALRYDKIQKLRTTYISDFCAKKTFESNGRKFNYNLEFHDENYINEYPIKDISQDSLIKRIENIEQITLMLLNTDLMQEVSKTPMIKDPIVKTNVLKMNNDFKNSLALYDYLVSYTKMGFAAVEIKKEYNPYSALVADELAEIGSLVSFLTYKYGNELSEVLEEDYLLEERRRQEIEQEELENQIKRLKKKVLESGESLEEYMISLEKRNKQLLENTSELKKEREENSKLKSNIIELKNQIELDNRNIELLQDVIKEKEDELIETKLAHQQEVIAINENHNKEILNLKELHSKDLIDLKEDITNQYNEEINDLNIRIEDLNEALDIKDIEHKNYINELMKSMDDIQNVALNQINDIKSEYALKENSLNEEVKKLMNDLDQTRESRDLAFASLNALRVKEGILEPNIDLTGEKEFKELEDNYLAFSKFFKKQWKLTKKEIRKEILWAKKKHKE